MTTIAYVFLDMDREELVPLDQQRQVIEKYAEEHGLFCDEWLIEQNYSPAHELGDRQEGLKLLAHIRKGDCIVLMQAKWMFSSAGAAVRILDILQEKGVSLHCIDLDGDVSRPTERKLVVSQGISQLVYKLCNIFSQGEGSQHGAAIRTAKARQKEAGKYMGGPVPFGWKVDNDGKMQRSSEEQQIIDEMMQCKKDNYSYREIARMMKEQYNLKFSHEGIRKIVLKYGRT